MMRRSLAALTGEVERAGEVPIEAHVQFVEQQLLTARGPSHGCSTALIGRAVARLNVAPASRAGVVS